LLSNEIMISFISNIKNILYR